MGKLFGQNKPRKTGGVTRLIKKLREMGHTELVDRFAQIVRAQAVREYLAAKEDRELTLEVGLAKEEIVNRMSRVNAVPVIPEEVEEDGELLLV